MRLETPDYGINFPIIPRPAKPDPHKKFREWAEGLGCEVGMFHLNVERKVFQDLAGEVVMPVQKYHLGMPEELLLQELLAQLGG